MSKDAFFASDVKFSLDMLSRVFDFNLTLIGTPKVRKLVKVPKLLSFLPFREFCPLEGRFLPRMA